jgi:hypothetical protein
MLTGLNFAQVFCDVMPRRLVDSCRRFGESYCHHLQGPNRRYLFTNQRGVIRNKA